MNRESFSEMESDPELFVPERKATEMRTFCDKKNSEKIMFQTV